MNEKTEPFHYKKTSKAEDIYDFLCDSILSGRWKPGDRLNDQELADEIHVSRISVREALFKLLETGAIEKIHWKGYFLKHIDEHLIEDIIEIRVVLESLALRNMLKDPNPDVFDEMEKTIDESETLLNKNGLVDYLKKDYHFHELLYTEQKNKYIAATLSNYLILIHFIRYISMGTEANFINTAELSIRDHREILDNLRKHNEKKALEMLATHLYSHEKKTKKELQQL